MKYYKINEIDNITPPKKIGFDTQVVKDFENQVAFFRYIEKEENKEIKELKQKLSDTDYQAIKFAEGHISEEEYLPIKEQRQAWRDRINELEAMLEVDIDESTD